MEEGSSVLESGLLLATLSADIYLLLPESWQLGRGKLGCKEKRSPGRSTADRIFRRRFSEPIVSLGGDLPLTNVEGERSRGSHNKDAVFYFPLFGDPILPAGDSIRGAGSLVLSG